MARTGLRGNEQMTLGEMITALKGMNTTWQGHDGVIHPVHVKFDFGETAPGQLTSWRGSYSELALTFNDYNRDAYYGYVIPTAGDFLRSLMDALRPGMTFGGWKGDEFEMTENTPVWVALWGQTSRTGVVGIRNVGYEIIIDTEWMEY